MRNRNFQDVFSDDPLNLLNVNLVEETKEISVSDQLLIENFEEINEFYEEYNREPSLNAEITEYMLASRLQGIRHDPGKVKKLLIYDFYNLLKCEESKSITVEDILGEDPLDLLNLGDCDKSIFSLKHVKENERIRPDFVSRRNICKKFDEYEVLFETVHKDLVSGCRKLVEFREKDLKESRFFVLRGVLLFLEKSEDDKIEFEFDSGTRIRNEGRTRCIFDNGTESNMLYRSLYKALLKDGFSVSDYQELMASSAKISDRDIQNGYIYVLKSMSNNPQIAEMKDLYKIGCCSGTVSDRIKNAMNEPTYLMSDVKIILTVRCYNISVFALESTIHDFFRDTNVSFEVHDRDNNKHYPREWYVVPLNVIEEAVQLIVDKKIGDYKYDPKLQLIIKK